MPAEAQVTNLQQFLPYLLAATTIILSASAYYIRDALRERSRVIKQKNDLDVARKEIELKLSAQEIAYKRELQDTITRLNERLTGVQERYQVAISREIRARRLLERRMGEIESRYKSNLQVLQDENLSLKKENRRLKKQLDRNDRPNDRLNDQPNKRPNDSL